jgi:hypothetical protein
MRPYRATSFNQVLKELLPNSGVINWEVVIACCWFELQRTMRFLIKAALVALFVSIAISQYRIARLLETSLYVQVATNEQLRLSPERLPKNVEDFFRGSP